MTKQQQKTVITQLELIMKMKIQKRSKLNYEITQIRETIGMVKSGESPQEDCNSESS